MNINGRAIGEGEKPYIIAEISCNHAGRLDILLDTIKAARDCGVDAVKLQTYTADDLTIKSDKEYFKLDEKEWGPGTYYDLYKANAMPAEFHEPAFILAKDLGLTIFSTPFSVEAVDFLETYNVPAYKIASMEANHTQLVQKIFSTHKPVIISLGGMSDKNVMDLLVTLPDEYRRNKLCLLHCISEYPAKPENMHLNRLRSLNKMAEHAGIDCIFGLSDHSISPDAAMIAVALGASVIEHHFILNDRVSSPDSKFSFTPLEMRYYVKRIHEAYDILGNVGTIPAVNKYARCIYTVKPIKKGEAFTADNIKFLRPAKGPLTSGRDYLDLIECKATAAWDIDAEQPLLSDDIDTLYSI